MSIQFEKISFEQYYKARTANSHFAVNESDAKREYEKYVTLPKRATTGSAGYDFCCPFTAQLGSDKTIIPTGIRIKIEPEDGKKLFLGIYPRSGLGFKYGMKLRNTTGIIDSDYYYADNEGHIMICVTTEKYYDLTPGERFAQGIIQEYFTVTDDEATKNRTGGMGSTGE